jgi:subtilisin family serine protease
MLKRGGRLRVYPATYADLHPTADYSLMGHRYLMRDHGLFVAGIIHTIAPRATLHLYEVLNPYGVGSIETIAQGLLRILANPDIERPLIINCSFMLDIPTEGVLDEDFPIEPRDTDILEHMRMSTREIFSWLTQQERVIVIAAAGNDAQHNNSNANGSRPHARYPAACDQVVGVGALPQGSSPTNGRYQAATYSNLSDAPPEVGYMTLGGEPGPKRGVLGVYIGEFPIYAEGYLSLLWRILGWAGPGHLPLKPHTFTPDRVKYKRNTTGWAWWAGTSFATPIISGLLATWRSRQSNQTGPFQFQEAQQALISLRQQQTLSGSSKAITTAQGENVILVMQE